MGICLAAYVVESCLLSGYGKIYLTASLFMIRKTHGYCDAFNAR